MLWWIAMNLVKGLDRIVLVIAIISTVPGFFVGFKIAHEKFKTETPEIIEWRKEAWETLKSIRDKTYNAAADTKDRRPPKMYNYLPMWQRIVSGFFGAVLGFFLVLFALRGTTRGVKQFSIWIIEGFKDKENPKESS